MISYGKQPFFIDAYVFQAEIVCPDCIAEWAAEELKIEEYNVVDIEQVVRDKGPAYNVGVSAYRAEALLEELATIWNINLEDEYSWDSDDFPKVIFADQIEDKEYCGRCLKVIE